MTIETKTFNKLVAFSNFTIYFIIHLKKIETRNVLCMITIFACSSQVVNEMDEIETQYKQ